MLFRNNTCMGIRSSVFKNNEHIPLQYTCAGKNSNPPLIFTDTPEKTKSLVLIVEDITATPKPWIHWLVFNIPKRTTHVKENEIPKGGTEGYANGGTFGYEGPCPKYFNGTHRYVFRLYALDTIIYTPKTLDKE